MGFAQDLLRLDKSKQGNGASTLIRMKGARMIGDRRAGCRRLAGSKLNVTVAPVSQRCHDIRHNGIHENDIRHNGIHENDIYLTGIQQNKIQLNNIH